MRPHRISRSVDCLHDGFKPIPWAPGYQFNPETHDVISCVRGKCGYRLTSYTMKGKVPYQAVTMVVDGKKQPVLIHNLVALFAHGPRPAGLVTRHWDGNCTNNAPENLVYGTQSENMHDAVRHGHNRNSNKTQCDHGHDYTPENTIHWGPERRYRRCRKCKNRNERNRYSSVQKSK